MHISCISCELIVDEPNLTINLKNSFRIGYEKDNGRKMNNSAINCVTLPTQFDRTESQQIDDTSKINKKSQY